MTMTETIEVPLTKGLVALIDEPDAALIEGRSWHADVRNNGRTYARTTEGRRPAYLHRLVLGVTDRWVYVDHENGNGLDCRRSNLRLSTPVSNRHNVPGFGGTSSFKGVFRAGARWRAQITAGGRKVSLGRFDTEHEAALAYNAAAIELHGDFAHLNVISVAPTLVS